MPEFTFDVQPSESGGWHIRVFHPDGGHDVYQFCGTLASIEHQARRLTEWYESIDIVESEKTKVNFGRARTPWGRFRKYIWQKTRGFL